MGSLQPISKAEHGVQDNDKEPPPQPTVTVSSDSLGGLVCLPPLQQWQTDGDSQKQDIAESQMALCRTTILPITLTK